MKNAARLAHVLGFGLFLGSVLAFAVASGVPAAGDFASLAVARRVISAGTAWVTLPGLCLILVSGVLLTGRETRIFEQRWTRVMVGIAGLVAVNTVLVVLPAVRTATALAQSSAAEGRLANGFASAYVRESVAGGVNILLALLAAVAGVWKFGSPRGPFARSAESSQDHVGVRP